MAKSTRPAARKLTLEEIDWHNFDWDGVPWKSIPWDDIDWDDVDLGLFTNLCPDNRRAEFEYGSYCVAKGARQEASLFRSGKYQSKVRRELDHLEEKVTKLSPEAKMAFWSVSNDEKHTNLFVNLVRQLDDVPSLFSPDATVRKSALKNLPSTVTHEEALRDQAEEAFDRFSSKAKEQLEKVRISHSIFDDPVERLCKLIRRASDGIREGKTLLRPGTPASVTPSVPPVSRRSDTKMLA